MVLSGTLYIIAAPSGAGKTVLVNALVKAVDNLAISISYTTRGKRPGEADGQNYFFLTAEKFAAMVAAGDFLEHARVFDHCYGTSRQWVEDNLHAGRDVVLEIDWQGARQVRSGLDNTVSIFILPPSYQALQKRLEMRQQDDAATVARRMADAKQEISHYGEFDYVLVNDDFDTALADLTAIIRAQRLCITYQQQKQAELLSKLL